VKSELSISIDTREPRPSSGSGARFELRGAHAADVRNRGGWVGYGGLAGVFLDVNRKSRVLSLSSGVHFIDSLDQKEVPFTELATLGGFGPMRGYYPGRLAGQSAAVAELAYRWPIWIWLDGSMRLEVGNVFGEHLRGFEIGRMRLSAAIGVESVSVADKPLEVLVGLGSETFESGAKIDSFRLFVGTHRGF
jgi:outer membrane protein assembly factor BamA